MRSDPWQSIVPWTRSDHTIEPNDRITRSNDTDPCAQLILIVPGDPDLVVIAVDDDGVTERAVLSDLLPRAPKILSRS